MPQVVQIADAMKADLGVQDKELAADMDLTAFEWSKAKHGARPWDVRDLLKAPPRVQWAFLRAYRAVLVADGATQPDTDLIDDITAKLATVRARMAKVHEVEHGEACAVSAITRGARV